MKCIECPYFFKDKIDRFPYCHYEEIGEAPCEQGIWDTSCEQHSLSPLFDFITEGTLFKNASNIRSLRKSTKMTQKEFSEYLHIPLRTLQNWEEGQRSCPSYVLELIAFRLKAEFPPTHPEREGQ